MTDFICYFCIITKNTQVFCEKIIVKSCNRISVSNFQDFSLLQWKLKSCKFCKFEFRVIKNFDLLTNLLTEGILVWTFQIFYASLSQISHFSIFYDGNYNLENLAYSNLQISSLNFSNSDYVSTLKYTDKYIYRYISEYRFKNIGNAKRNYYRVSKIKQC